MCEVGGTTAELLDVWSSSTFGRQLCAELHESQAVIERYHHESARLEGLDPDEDLAECLAGNQYFGEFEALQLRVAEALAGREIRVWHYTRLFDFEIAAMKKAIELSTEERMRARLIEVKRRGHLTEQEFQKLLEGSALKTQRKNRENLFFCIASPVSVTDRGVELLLGNWGGEVVYFHQKDETLQRKLRTMGFPRVVEVAVEISDPLLRYSLAGCILNTCALDLGFPLYPGSIDLGIKEDPPAAKVVRIHTYGEHDYQELGRTYPDGADILFGRHERWNNLLND